MVHFPNEIWLEVAGYLKLPTDVCTRKHERASEDERVKQQTLLSSCLVSKQLRAVFQPQLYRNFVKYRRPAAKARLLEPDSEWQHRYYQQDERSFRAVRKRTRLEKFLTTVVQRPDLAAMVEQLRIGLCSDHIALPRYLQPLYEKIPPGEVISITLVDALRSFKGFGRLHNRFRRFWEEALRDGDEGAEAALLLTLLPNLLSLRLESDTGDINIFVQELYNTILDARPKSWTLATDQGVLRKHPINLQLSLQQPPEILPVLTSLDT
ncbi:hypothetical protein QM012_001553 [Aureobasidium pullulans]|uniref:F-box domain-containing protein n=1 Tax=Aureobasidium pullulans TaxID=5580 RepID=A0ABR0TEF1_AURPU